MKKLLFSAALCLLTALFLSGCVLLEPFEKTSTITTSQIYTEDGSAAGYEEKEWSLEGKLVRETQYDAEDRVVADRVYEYPEAAHYRMSVYDADGELVETREVSYEGSIDFPTEERVYYPSGQLSSWICYQIYEEPMPDGYPLIGLFVTHGERYAPDGTILECWEDKYFDNGPSIGYQGFYEDGVLRLEVFYNERAEVELERTYDMDGNLIYEGPPGD